MRDLYIFNAVLFAFGTIRIYFIAKLYALDIRVISAKLNGLLKLSFFTILVWWRY